MNVKATASTQPFVPDLPTHLCALVLTVVPKLDRFRALHRWKPVRKQRFDDLIQVLPRSIAPSIFCSAFLSLAETHPWAAYAALYRLVNQYWRRSDGPFVERVIHDLQPVLRIPARILPRYHLDATDHGADFKPPTKHGQQHPEEPEVTLAGAFAVILGVNGRWKLLEHLISRLWIKEAMWFNTLLHHCLREGDEEGFEWWENQGLRVPQVLSAEFVLEVVRGRYGQSLDWLAEHSQGGLGQGYFQGLTIDQLVTAAVESGSTYMLDCLWALVDPEDPDDFGFEEQHWQYASWAKYDGERQNVRVLEWAKSREIPFPEPEDLMEGLDQARTVQVLDWWLKHLLRNVDNDTLRYSTNSMDYPSASGDLDRLNWWLNSGLELRFSPKSLSAARRRPEVEKWWDQCLQYKLLSGAISLEEASNLGIMPCRDWETLCAWGRLDLLNKCGFTSEFSKVPATIGHSLIFAACTFGQLDVLERSRSILDLQMDSVDRRNCVNDALSHNQVAVLQWLYDGGYTRAISPRQWHGVIVHVLDSFCDESVTVRDAIEWICEKRLLPVPPSQQVIETALDCLPPSEQLAIVYRMWKHCGLGIYSYRVTDRLIRMVLNAGCNVKDMVAWWLSEQGNILHPVHLEMLEEAAEWHH